MEFDSIRTWGALEVPGFDEPHCTKLVRPLEGLIVFICFALVADRLVVPGETLLDEASVAYNLLQPETDAAVVGSPEINKPFTGYAGHDFLSDIGRK